MELQIGHGKTCDIKTCDIKTERQETCDIKTRDIKTCDGRMPIDLEIRVMSCHMTQTWDEPEEIAVIS